MASHKTTSEDLIDDSILATPIPRASSTLDKRSKYKIIKRPQNRKCEDTKMEQGLAAIEEMKKKLNVRPSIVPPDSIWICSKEETASLASSNTNALFKKQFSKVHGDSTVEFNESLPKKEMQMEESGFTNLQNISDLERDELECRRSWGYIPSDKMSDMSLTAIENSKIAPPDFMPVEDSLFSELKAFNVQDENNVILNSQKYKETKQNSDMSLLKHDLTQINSDIPSLADIALALKCIEEECDARQIMDELLRAGKRINPTDDLKRISESIDLKSLQMKETLEDVDTLKLKETPQEVVDQKSIRVKDTSEAIKSFVESFSTFTDNDKKLITIEDSLIWGNVQIGHCKKRIIHIIHTEQKPGTYTFTVHGNNAFKISVNEPEESSPSRRAFSSVHPYPCTYELYVLFQPNDIGQARGMVKIMSQSDGTSKEVNLMGYGGKGTLIMRDLCLDVASNISYIFFYEGFNATFKMFNSGSSTLFFYFDLGILEDFCCMEPKLGLLEPCEMTNLTMLIHSKEKFISNWLSSCEEDDLEIGKISLYFGDEATRLRLNNLDKNLEEKKKKKLFAKNYPFLTNVNFPRSRLEVDLLVDTKNCYMDLMYNGIKKTEIGIKIPRNVLYYHQILVNTDVERVIDKRYLLQMIKSLPVEDGHRS